jgi:hypothetical protein
MCDILILNGNEKQSRLDLIILLEKDRKGSIPFENRGLDTQITLHKRCNSIDERWELMPSWLLSG